MAYLQLSPLIIALRERPADFEIDRGWLTHFPSRHSFKFDREGNVRSRAYCDCASLSIRPEDGQEFWVAFRTWHTEYWRPIEINREFSAHFRRPNPVQRFVRWLVVKARRSLLEPMLDQEPDIRPGAVRVPVPSRN
jgi:hypothetical protein